MPTSPNSSRASAPCRPPSRAHGGRLEWRPSRLLASALLTLGALSGLSVLACEMPLQYSLPLALLAAGEGVRLARGELRRPERRLVIGPDAGAASLDGRAVTGLAVEWRGPLAFLRFRDEAGRSRRLAWWPDTLPATARRELRLAVPVQAAAQPPASMAP